MLIGQPAGSHHGVSKPARASLTLAKLFGRIPTWLPAMVPGAIGATTMLYRIGWELWWGRWRVRITIARRR